MVTVSNTHQAIVSDELFEKEKIITVFEQWIAKIEERENRWDVKILDYILENYKSVQLFYDIIHPTELLMGEMVDRLMKKIGMGICERKNQLTFLNSHEMPVYPCVKKVLGLKWSKETMRDGKFGKRAMASMNLREYIKEYAWWCYGKSLQ